MTIRRTLSGWYIHGSTPQWIVASAVKLLGEVLLAGVLGGLLAFIPQIQAFTLALTASYGIPTEIRPVYAFTIFVYVGLTRCSWINEANASPVD